MRRCIPAPSATTANTATCERRRHMKHFPNRRALLAAGAAAALAPFAHAQTYPSRVVSIVVPFGPGNAYDLMVRYLADKMRDATGQPFIVEAKQGALGG